MAYELKTAGRDAAIAIAKAFIGDIRSAKSP
jgi:hypothetical protein